jgi:hypothetical protein
LISREEKGRIAMISPRESAAFKAVVKPAGAVLGIGKNRVTSSGWASLDSSSATSVPPLTYQMWCWLELVAPF